MAPSVCAICASMARPSRVNKRSPCLTNAPSLKCTAVMLVSTRALSATLAIGVTLPSASSRTGTFLRSTRAVSTGTTRSARGCERADSVVHWLRIRTAIAMTASAATPKSHFRLLICNLPTQAVGDPLPGCSLSGEAARIHPGPRGRAPLAYKRPAVHIPALAGKHGPGGLSSCPNRNFAMRIATWNVNSVRQRLDSLQSWLKERDPDIVCLQEIKCTDEAFPREPLEALGYNVAVHGQKTFNGVALLSKLPFDEVA